MADRATMIDLAPGGAERAAVLACRRSPGGHLADEMAQGSGSAVALRELPFLTQLSIRVVPDGPGAAAVESTLGIRLPRRVGEVTGAADGSARAVLWLGPDEFLLVDQDEAVTGLAPARLAELLSDAVGDHAGQVVDVSANRTTLELTGPSARTVLDKSCRLDLHPRAFATGSARMTLLESTPVILWRTDTDAWRVLPRASFSTHVIRWLLDGMREFRR